MRTSELATEADWSIRCTVSEAERQLVNFTFKGPGAYPTSDGGEILVIPVDREIERMWNKEYTEDEFFDFEIWSRPTTPYFNAMIKCPRREC